LRRLAKLPFTLQDIVLVLHYEVKAPKCLLLDIPQSDWDICRTAPAF